MKREGDPVKLRVAWGDVPEPGDVLLFASGRRLMVHRIGGAKTLHCIVLGPGDEAPGRTLDWMWSPRKRRAR